MKEILLRAEKDRAIRSALLMLKDILNMASALGGFCHISADYFAQKYNYTTRTFFRHKRCLVKHGYIRERSRWQVEVINPIDDKNSDTYVANRDKNVSLNSSKNSDKSGTNCDTNVSNRDTNVIQKQINKKTNNKRGAISDFIALPQELNPFGNLKLKENELEQLQIKYGEESLKTQLPRASAWLTNNPRKWQNHYAGLCNWLSNRFVSKSTTNTFNPYATSASNW